MSTPKNPGLAVIIGRFQPYHRGHQAIVSNALDKFERVLVLIGSTGCAPNYRNPWPPHAIAEMISRNHSLAWSTGQLQMDVIYDNPYDDAAWTEGVRGVVAKYDTGAQVTLIGHRKDASSFYLDLFPHWQLLEAPLELRLDATEVREGYFLPHLAYSRALQVEAMVGHHTMAAMRHFHRNTLGWFGSIAAEAAAVHQHNEDWASRASERYEVQHNAVDVLARDGAGRLLLIRRGGAVGKDQLAMPGGFVNKGERLVAAAVREFGEETSITLNPSQYTGVPMVCFDHPGRSMRGRVFTHVLCVLLTPQQAAEACAGDDAAEIVWLHPRELNLHKPHFFSDHFFILKALLGEGVLKAA